MSTMILASWWIWCAAVLTAPVIDLLVYRPRGDFAFPVGKTILLISCWALALGIVAREI